MRKFLCCVAKKYTKEAISTVQEVNAFSEYHAVNELEKVTGIKIDGNTNYMDYVEI